MLGERASLPNITRRDYEELELLYYPALLQAEGSQIRSNSQLTYLFSVHTSYPEEKKERHRDLEFIISCYMKNHSIDFSEKYFHLTWLRLLSIDVESAATIYESSDVMGSCYHIAGMHHGMKRQASKMFSKLLQSTYSFFSESSVLFLITL